MESQGEAPTSKIKRCDHKIVHGHEEAKGLEEDQEM
jgi:hypothetical protein